ncbi:unnamed protein product [Caenorhabditis nigoni]
MATKLTCTEKQTLTNKRLISAYNQRFEIKEEMDAIKKLEFGEQTRRYRQLVVQLTFIDNIIAVGESEYTKKRLQTVGKLYAVLRTHQIHN